MNIKTLFLALFITGCTYGYPEEIEYMNKVCKNNGGIDRFSYTAQRTHVWCKNGGEFSAVVPRSRTEK